MRLEKRNYKRTKEPIECHPVIVAATLELTCLDNQHKNVYWRNYKSYQYLLKNATELFKSFLFK